MFGSSKTIVTVALTLPLLSSGGLRADDWPQWRGPNRDGVWSETGILQKFPAEGLKIRWRAPVGWGFSSPVVAQGRVYLADALVVPPRPQERLHCLDEATGQALWTHGPCAVREVQEQFPEASRPAYTTVQTMLYRLEAKKVVRRVKKIGNAHIFEAAISRVSAQGRLIDEFFGLFGGRAQPVMAHLIETGRLTLDDVREAERLLQALEAKETGS